MQVVVEGAARDVAELSADGYRRFDGRAEDFLAREIATMAEAHLKPKLIFWRCLDLMARERVQLPGEHRLTALIASALQCRKQRLIDASIGS